MTCKHGSTSWMCSYCDAETVEQGKGPLPSARDDKRGEENWERMVRLLRDPRATNGRPDILHDAASMIERLVGYLAMTPDDGYVPPSRSTPSHERVFVVDDGHVGIEAVRKLLESDTHEQAPDVIGGTPHERELVRQHLTRPTTEDIGELADVLMGSLKEAGYVIGLAAALHVANAVRYRSARSTTLFKAIGYVDGGGYARWEPNQGPDLQAFGALLYVVADQGCPGETTPSATPRSQQESDKNWLRAQRDVAEEKVKDFELHLVQQGLLAKEISDYLGAVASLSGGARRLLERAEKALSWPKQNNRADGGKA